MLCLATAGSTQAQVQMTVKSFNSLRPAKADVTEIEEGVEAVQEKIAQKGSSSEIGKNINWLQAKVDNIKKDFPKYKKIAPWETQIDKFREENSKLKAVEDANYKAKKKKEDAIHQVSESMRRSGIERDITSYRSNPVVGKGNEIAEGYSFLAQAMEKFRADYPNETESEVIKRAIDVESYVKGDFMSSYLEKSKEKRASDDGIIAEHRASSPDRAINILKKRTALGNKLTAAFPDQTFFAENQANDKKLLAEIESYKNDGGFEQFKKDAIILDAPQGKDPYVEGDIRKALEKEGYEVIVVNIQDDRWVLVKNDFDLPKHKEKAAVVGLRKDGKCYRMWGTYRQPYSGAGTYMKEGYFRWNDPKEMNCNNCK